MSICNYAGTVFAINKKQPGESFKAAARIITFSRYIVRITDLILVKKKVKTNHKYINISATGFLQKTFCFITVLQYAVERL